MAKFSVFLALCFFFCVASAQLDPTAKIVEFDSSLLVAGSNITEWMNTGSLGGTLLSVGGVGVPVQAECGGLNRGQGVFFNGEVFEGDLAAPITFSASDAVVVVIVASSTGPTSGILTTGPAGGPGTDPALLGPGALYTGVYTQDAEDVSVGNVNTFAAAAVGDAVAVAFVYETPIGNTGNDFWITADNSGTTVSGLGANVRNQFGWAAIGDRLGVDTGFVGCIHYLAIYQVLTTPVNEDALASTLLDLALEFNVATNQTTASPAPRTTATTGSTTGTTGSTTGSRTTGRRATTHMSSATIPAVPSLLFAAIVSFFLFFLW